MRWLAVILLIPSLCFGACEIPDVLMTLAPGAQWNLSGDKYSGIQWLDTIQAQPTALAVAQAIATCKTQQTSRLAAKAQARLDVKNTGLTQIQRLQALLILLDYDQ
jgi:hypothetical protein